jgi:carboxymethylenebutenolidase
MPPVVESTVVHTSAGGLLEGMVSIPTADVAVPAYRAAPAEPGKHPIVLVVQEIFGVHEYIKDVARRLAKLGYLAVAPELYYRQGDVSKLEGFEAIRPLVAKVPDAQVLSDLDASLAWAEANGADGTRVAVTGFCWGGRITWLYAAHQPRVKAGVAWYGRLVGEATPLQPRHPVDVAADVKAPVLGLYGADDASIPQDTIERMREALGHASPSRIHVYPAAGHAFHADYRPNYRKEAAEDGWKRLAAWLPANGV